MKYLFEAITLWWVFIFTHRMIGAVLLVLIVLILLDMNIKSERKIILPREAHNTIGEIPLVEHFDDGDLGGKSGWGIGLVSTMCMSYDGFSYEYI